MRAVQGAVCTEKEIATKHADTKVNLQAKIDLSGITAALLIQPGPSFKSWAMSVFLCLHRERPFFVKSADLSHDYKSVERNQQQIYDVSISAMNE